MYCPKCGFDNKQNANFCKKCGNPLNIHSNVKQTHEKSQLKNNSSHNNTKIILITIIVILLIILGTFLFLSNNNGNNNFLSNDNDNNNNPSNNTENNTVDTTVDTTVETSGSTEKGSQSSNALKIISGSFNTGSSLSDKTYITVYVGEEHAGEKVKIRVLYSRDGSQLNPGNIVAKTVDSTGHFTMKSANAFKYYPDHAYVTLYDGNGNVVDTKDIDMSPSSGIQTF